MAAHLSNNSNALEARGITKRYRLPHHRSGTLFEQLLGYTRGAHIYETFAALADVSFSVGSGEMVGLVGKNGSGKTTLLKVLGGIIEPSEGSYATRGTIAPLLSLSVGFHHELSAEENLHLYGAILGLPRRAIKEKLETVFARAGVERFRNLKLKHFSSGMIARLAFALMVQTNPDILLLDEIFAVGDKDFKPHCLATFREYQREGKTIIFASHDLETVAEYCGRTLLLHEGRLVMFDETKKVLETYKNL